MNDQLRSKLPDFVGERISLSDRPLKKHEARGTNPNAGSDPYGARATRRSPYYGAKFAQSYALARKDAHA